MKKINKKQKNKMNKIERVKNEKENQRLMIIKLE
jgi:hypothetical protein